MYILFNAMSKGWLKTLIQRFEYCQSFDGEGLFYYVANGRGLEPEIDPEGHAFYCFQLIAFDVK